MDPKKIIRNKSFCVLPWSGFELEPNGNVKNCIISTETIGNINESHIKDILLGSKNKTLKKEMLDDKKPRNCRGCHLQELGRNNPSSISSRLYYNRELALKTDLSLFDDVDKFSLQHIDLRWTNHCNQACVYCGPSYSSKWATELNRRVDSGKKSKESLKQFVFDNIKNLKNVYLAGGEPLIMNENKELLQKLLQDNPEVSIRVNTNLSSTKTGVFELLCNFKNVHWTVSVETIEKEYEYVRYHGSWKDFLVNLRQIKKLDQKITFNMLYFMLNYKSLFDTVDFFKDMGFHENSFVIGPLYAPQYLNIHNLPSKTLQSIMKTLELKISQSDHYLKNSYENILKYISTSPIPRNIDLFFKNMEILDKRRNQSWQKTFPILAEELSDV